VGERGGIADKTGNEGDCGRAYIRSGLHGGAMPSFEGDGGSMGTGDSLRRANLTVVYVCVWNCCGREDVSRMDALDCSVWCGEEGAGLVRARM